MKRIAPAIFALALIPAGVVLLSAAQSASAPQQSQRPYTQGRVINVSYIRTKPGMFNKYVGYLQGDWKKLLEAEKAAGAIVDYAVYSSSETRNPGDHDIMLVTTYRNMAAFDGLQDRTDAIATKVLSTSTEQMDQRSADRGAMRDVIGNRVYREMLLK